MTLSDDEMFRLQQLEAEVAFMRNTLGRWRQNGADSFFQESGFRFGQNVDIGEFGIQILAPTTLSQTAMMFVPEYLTSSPLEYIFGGGTAALISGFASPADTNLTFFTFNPTISVIDLFANSPLTTASGGTRLQLTSDNDSGVEKVAVLNVPFQFPVLAADPAVLEDGMVWYRSDTDVFRGRANGVTVTFTVT